MSEQTDNMVFPSKVMENVVSSLTKLDVTLEHIVERLGKVEDEVKAPRGNKYIEARIGKLEEANSIAKSHDWKLYAYIFVAVAGSITGAWNQLSTAQEKVRIGLVAQIDKSEATLRESMGQRLAPMQQASAFAERERVLLNTQIQQARDDRKVADEVIQRELSVREGWFREIAENQSRFDERQKTLDAALQLGTEDRMRKSEFLSYKEAFDMRIEDLREQSETRRKRAKGL